MKTTGFSRVSKELIIGELSSELQQRPLFFITQHSGLSAAALDKLRAKLRKADARYFVVKNSFGKRALDKAKIKGLSETFSGACGFAFASGDPVMSSKILVDFSKENQTFKLQSGYMNGQVMAVDQIKALASLPSREVLIAMVVGGIQAPISRFVNVLSATVRSVVTVLDAIAKKKGSGS